MEVQDVSVDGEGVDGGSIGDGEGWLLWTCDAVVAKEWSGAGACETACVDTLGMWVLTARVWAYTVT